MISYFNTHQLQKVSQTWYTLAHSNICMPSDRPSLWVHLLSFTSPLWRVWQRTIKTSFDSRLLSALSSSSSRERKNSLITSRFPQNCSRPKWSLILFLFSWIDIYVGASFPFYPQRTVGGGGFPSIFTRLQSNTELCLGGGGLRRDWSGVGRWASTVEVGQDWV